jgi:hypothetical protein
MGLGLVTGVPIWRRFDPRARQQLEDDVYSGRVLAVLERIAVERAMLSWQKQQPQQQLQRAEKPAVTAAAATAAAAVDVGSDGKQADGTGPADNSSPGAGDAKREPESRSEDGGATDQAGLIAPQPPPVSIETARGTQRWQFRKTRSKRKRQQQRVGAGDGGGVAGAASKYFVRSGAGAGAGAAGGSVDDSAVQSGSGSTSLAELASVHEDGSQTQRGPVAGSGRRGGQVKGAPAFGRAEDYEATALSASGTTAEHGKVVSGSARDGGGAEGRLQQLLDEYREQLQRQEARAEEKALGPNIFSQEILTARDRIRAAVAEARGRAAGGPPLQLPAELVEEGSSTQVTIFLHHQLCSVVLSYGCLLCAAALFGFDGACCTACASDSSQSILGRRSQGLPSGSGVYLSPAASRVDLACVVVVAAAHGSSRARSRRACVAATAEASAGVGSCFPVD